MIPYEIVAVWENWDCTAPYTLTPTGGDSVKMFAIKIEDDYYLLGEPVYITALESQERGR